MEVADKNVYVISLDAVDLNLLPSIYNTHDDRIVPLWTKSNLDWRKNELYQFQIKGSKENVKEELPQLKFENIACEICNIDVPKPFLREHRKSLRHVTNVKIADIAVNRMRKYINNTDAENCTDHAETNPMAYFCDVCVTVVKINEKVNHVESLAHKNSVILDKIFSDFLVYYDCKEEIDCKANNKVMNKNIDVLDTKQLVDNKMAIDKSNTNLKTKHKIPIDASDTLLKNDVKSKNERIPEATNKILLSDYLSILNSLVDYPMFFKLQNDFIEIETIDGSVVKVRENNFHGFNKIGKNVKCHLCCENFKEKFIDNHKMSMKHVENMILPLGDKHCMRQIDSCLGHCIICNTEFSGLHSIDSIEHKKNLIEAVIFDSGDEYYQHLTREFEKKDITVSKDSGVPRKDEDSKRIEINSKPNKYHYLMTEKENKLMCEICDVKISNDNEYVRKHVSKTEHLEKYNQILNNNKIKQINNLFYCEPCDQVLLEKHELLHIKMKSHQEKCNTVAVDEDKMDPFQCGVCNVNVPNYEQNILEHLNGRSHSINVKNLNASSEDDDGISKAVQEVHYQMELTKFPLLLKCNICNIIIFQNEKLLSDHLASKKHISNYNKLLEDNYLMLKQNDCFCNICKVSVGIKSELMHAKGKKHIKTLQKLELPSVNVGSLSTAIVDPKVVIDENNVPSNVIDRPSGSNVKNINNTNICQNNTNMLKKCEPLTDIEPEMLAQLQPAPDPKQVICKICKVAVPFNKHNVTTHMNGMKHAAQKLLLEEGTA